MEWGTFGGWAGAIAGSLMGLLGGAIGTYCSIRNTRGPKERAFMIRAAVGCWLFVGLFITGLWLIPAPYSILVILVYVALLLLGIRRLNAVQARLRQEEA